ncbi:MAG: hypothetical protein EOO11_21175, partial [Chitinophagaceae bacterium]
MPAKPHAFFRKLYPFLWMALAYFTILLLNDLAGKATLFPQRAANHAWRLPALTLLHFFLFEYTIAGIRRRPALLTALLFAAHIAAYSWGMYG